MACQSRPYIATARIPLVSDGNLARKKPTESAELKWQRFMLAFMAVSLLVAGTVCRYSPYMNETSRTFIGGTLFKVGIVLGIAWLAAPQLAMLGWQRVRGTLLAAVTIVILLMAIRPRIGALAASLLIAGSAVFSAIGWFRSLTKPD